MVRAYDNTIPEIDVYAAELNQVWTNRIDNALDAMDGEGTLRLSTSLDGDEVVIEVADSGPGIDPDVQMRVFEPFFTSKDVGSGSGLGLVGRPRAANGTIPIIIGGHDKRHIQ